MSTTIKFKNPNAPATEPQTELFNKILSEKGYPAMGFREGTTMKEASEAIDAAKELPKAVGTKPEPKPQPTLQEMAAAIAGNAAPNVAPMQDPQQYDCTWCNDTGIFGEDDDGMDEDGAPIIRTIYCKCPKGKNYGKPVAPAEDDLEAQAPVMLAFDKAECAALKSALSVAICETDGSEMDHVLTAKITAFLDGAPQPTHVQLPDYIGGGTVQL